MVTAITVTPTTAPAHPPNRQIQAATIPGAHPGTLQTRMSAMQTTHTIYAGENCGNFAVMSNKRMRPGALPVIPAVAFFAAIPV